MEAALMVEDGILGGEIQGKGGAGNLDQRNEPPRITDGDMEGAKPDIFLIADEVLEEMKTDGGVVVIGGLWRRILGRGADARAAHIHQINGGEVEGRLPSGLIKGLIK